MPSLFPPNILPFVLGGPNILTQNLAGLGIIPPLWGIFDKRGRNAIQFDNVLAVEYRQDWTLSDYPVEEGAFATYDKVQVPFNIRMLVSGGRQFSNRQRFLLSIPPVATSLELFDVVTPEVTYLDCNVVHYDYGRRADEGLGLIKVAIWLMQVRLVPNVTPGNASTKQPAGAPIIVGGQVQSVPTVVPPLTRILQGIF